MSEMRHVVHQPEGQLRRYVREIVWVRSERPRVQILLPETTLTMALRQTGAASLCEEQLPTAVVSGLQRGSRRVEHAAGSSLVIVRFTEIGATAMLHDRADLLYNRTLALDSVVPRQKIDDVQNMLGEAHEPRQKIAAVEGFLLSRIRTRDAVSPQIEAAAQMIRRSEGRCSIGAVARHAAMSQSALERHFRAVVGTTPKMLSRLARLQHICRLWDAGKSLTEIAFEAGYFDQPHMARDFRQLAGASPEEFFLSASPRNLPTFYK